MKITDIHVDGFGVWNSMTADDLSHQVTLFYGPNEAGKTTLMQFVRAVLYGFSTERRHLYLPPVFGGVPGGLLRVNNHNGDFTVERRLEDDDQTIIGRAIVLADNGSRQGQHLLNVLLAGIDESIFNNVFAVGIRELQELATLNDTQAAEQLYNLASGVDRVSLVEVMRHLEAERTRIWQVDGKSESELAGLLAQRDRLKAEYDHLEMQTRRWADLAHQQRSLVAETNELEQRISHFEFDARTVEISIQVRDKWRKRADLNRQITGVGRVDPLPEGCVGRLDELNLAIEAQRELLEPKKERRLSLRRELAAQPINKALWDRASRIEAACEHAPWLASLGHEINTLSADVEAADLQLMKYDEELATQGGVALANNVVVSPKAFQQLLAPAHTLREALRKRVVARTHQKKTRQDAEHAVEDLQAELQGRDAENFEEALDRVANIVKLLRRRIQVEERLAAIENQSAELEAENHELVDSQFQRVRLFVGIGIIFVFGVVLMLTGIFGAYIMPLVAEVRWGLGLLGVLVTAVASAWKTVVERTGQEELDECFRRRETLERELDDAIEERDRLDRQLPSGTGTLAARLATAEKELKELEDKVPLQHDRKQAERRTHESKRYTSGVEEELREAKSRWRRALRTAGLPETLTPKHVRQLSAHLQKKTKVQSDLVEKRQRLERLTADRNALIARLRQLNTEIGVQMVSPDPQLQLSQLATALSGQRGMVDRRRQLQKEEKEVRRELATGLKEVRRLLRSREALFAEARVTDEGELRERAGKLQLLADLSERRDALTEQILAIIGAHCGETDIERELSEHAKEELDARWNMLLSKLHDAQALLGQLHQRHGEINQEMKTLSEDRRLAAAKFELGCLNEQVAAMVKQWRGMAVTHRLLEDIRVSYEAERQPETLGEASLYLQRLTQGKYTRVWTPLGRNELRVDDAQGKPMSLDVLSRGTREAIFLSLRMALVAAYGRRGVNLPMILDDVLVNLDHRRAELAVSMMCDFAKEGRQLLFFTCHEHIKAMFLAAGVDVRMLPAHGTPGTQVRRFIPPTPVVHDVLLDFVPPDDEEEIPAEIWEQASPIKPAAPPAQIIIEEPPLRDEEEYVLAEEDEAVADDLDYVFAELEDDKPFDDGNWWWEPTHRWSVEEEETAA